MRCRLIRRGTRTDENAGYVIGSYLDDDFRPVRRLGTDDVGFWYDDHVFETVLFERLLQLLLCIERDGSI